MARPETTRTLGSPIDLARAEQLTVRESNPAAGATSVRRRVAGGFVERLELLFLRFVTDANAATRVVSLELQTPDNLTMGRFVALATQTASNTVEYTWARGVGESRSTDSQRTQVFPELYLQPGFSFLIVLDNAQAGDQVSQLTFTLTRFLWGADGYVLGRDLLTPAELVGFESD